MSAVRPSEGRGDRLRTPPTWLEPGLAEMQESGLARFRDLPDDALLPPAPEFHDTPGARYAGTPDGLRRLIYEMLTSAGIDPSLATDEVSHETEHAAAARALGCEVRFAFLVVIEGGRWGFQASSSWKSPYPLSKLAFAAIAAAPSRLSDSDEAYLRALGYRDARDVAGRIRRRSAACPVPLPASVRGLPCQQETPRERSERW